MDILVNKNSFFVFDLDDTLYHEIDYVKSAYKEIARLLSPNSNKQVFDVMLSRFHKDEEVLNYILGKYKVDNYNFEKILTIYRNHIPNIKLKPEALLLLKQLFENNIKTGLITDGRTITQNNKIKSLGIDKYFDLIIISEEFGKSKPSEENFRIFMKKFGKHKFYYFGDNISKDFLSPNRLGWVTICLLDQGYNIHHQNFSMPTEYLAQKTIKSFSDIKLFFN